MGRKNNGLTLGELITKLKTFDESSLVEFDFCRFVPTDIDSYRGHYEDLAIGFKQFGPDINVKNLIEMLEKCIGEIFHGYKGGEFTMGSGTDLWVANDGDTTNTFIADAEELDDVVYLVTGIQE